MEKAKRELIQEFIIAITKMRKFVHKSSPTSIQEKLATILQIQALRFLKEKPKTTVGDLSKRLNMSSAAIAQFCDRLESNHWIKREVDIKDRRIIHLILTDQGIKELKRIQKKHFQKMSKIFSLLEEEDLKKMVEIMSKLIKRIEEKGVYENNN